MVSLSSDSDPDEDLESESAPIRQKQPTVMVEDEHTDPHIPDESSEGYDTVLYPPNVKWLLYPDEEDLQNVSHSLESLQVTGKYWILL